MKFLWNGKKKDRRSLCRSINGYISTLGLICFFLLIQVLGLLSVYILNNAYLIKVDHQSILDLSCISQAEAIALHNTQIRVCQKDPSQLILRKEIQIQDVSVMFQDQETYMECCYEKDNKKVQMILYYDDTGIVDLDYR